jgi:hypothetical protein
MYTIQVANGHDYLKENEFRVRSYSPFESTNSHAESAVSADYVYVISRPLPIMLTGC